MLKWLKSDSTGAVPRTTPRPPWIQKISQNAEKSPAPDDTSQWRSRLAQKLRELKAQPDLPGAEKNGIRQVQDFAFHIMPLDLLSDSGPEMSAAPSEPLPAAAAPDTELTYRLQPPQIMAYSRDDYEFAHSTLAYERGEAFDIDALFENSAAAALPPNPWNAPPDAVEALVGGRAPAPATPVRTAVSRQKHKSPEIVLPLGATPPLEDFIAAWQTKEDDVDADANGENALTPVARAAQRSDSPPGGRPSPSRDNPSERASVTPRVVMHRQQELRFPLLKTQRKTLEFANPAEAQAVIDRLVETLEQFSIEGHVVGIQRGPIITRYELKMAAGIKVSRILALTDELAMALEAMRVRIEAPIPGRSTVGIEIPNKQRIKVLLGDILNDVGYKEFGGALPLPLGRDIAGNLLLEDLTRMPHLLIAGATGSGKSVAVNSFISSLILYKTPEEVRFLLVDPKLVELSGYNDIPHLLHPVITEPNKAILALNWAVEEMERRYEDLAEMGARDIRSYNEKIRLQKKKTDLSIMPYIVVLIDELGDLMMVAGKEVESSIIRLAQKARAVGIHLILATQRPSVDVITALIKANCPARIALQVAQKTDSRTILDGNGAEQLLGQGDMLFRHPSRAQLIRAQVPLIEDNEVEDVVAYARKLAKPAYITLEDPKGKMGELEAGDEELFEEAWQVIVESQKASASYLQRRLRIGYNKAARLIEAFEARGFIGPQIGSKPREVIGGTGQGVQARVT